MMPETGHVLSRDTEQCRMPAIMSEDMSCCGCHVATVYGPRMEVAELAHLRRARDLLIVSTRGRWTSR